MTRLPAPTDAPATGRRPADPLPADPPPAAAAPTDPPPAAAPAREPAAPAAPGGPPPEPVATERPPDAADNEPAAANPGAAASGVGVRRGDAPDIASLVLGAPPRYTRDEVAELTGVGAPTLRRLWRAIGFPDVGDARVFTDYDVAALRHYRELLDDGAIDIETGLRLVRAMGRQLTRLAEWEVGTLAEWLESGGGPSEHGHALAPRDLAERYLAAGDELLRYVWRRRLAAEVERVAGLGDLGDGLLSMWLTIGFADLVGYTQYVRTAPPIQVARIVEQFETGCADVVASLGGRVVKTLGDSVMYVAFNPAVAVEASLRIVELVEEANELLDLPRVRVGLATGTVIARLGDVYGTPVNRADRLTELARRGRVVCDEETARALDGVETLSLRRMAPRTVHGLGVVHPYAVRRREPRAADAR